MTYLSAVTLLWAFSFSLIGVYLAGQVDAWFSVLMRVALASLLFIPFLKFRGVGAKLILKLMAIGGIQLGLMYCFYYQSFLLLSVPEVLLFTVFTPIYITLLNDMLTKRFSFWYLVSAIIAVIGAIFIKYSSVSGNFILGFIIVQCANLCFAIGQVSYKYLMKKQTIALSQHNVFGYFYLGALCVATIAFLLMGNPQKLPTNLTQWLVLTYLGLIASGVGYFAWNKGVTLVNTGCLAVMNNMLVPAGLIVNVVIWNRDADLVRLSIGGGIIIFSLWLNETWIKQKQAAST